ncbi:MAG: hypothetical protein ABSA51_04140 [Anaerolineaceae bacterium]|jgi:hypothetical protein
MVHVKGATKCEWDYNVVIDTLAVVSFHALLKDSDVNGLGRDKAAVWQAVLPPSRTIADLANAESIAPVHLAEALQYRPRMEI